MRTPVAGTVLWLRVRPGEHYSPLSPGRDAIAILGDLSALRARLDVDERDFPRVIVGARAEIVAASDSGGARRRARVVAIGQRVGRKNVRTDDPIERIDTKIVEVEVELEDGAGLKPGLRVVGYVEPGAP